jgi:hypothetical protein|tara:strand:- start:394 stop:918 length:525 start_codon:yes stop_codon:yes gene_type:complete
MIQKIKDYQKNVEVPIQFFELYNENIDSEYFIDRIEKGIIRENNKNYKTNVFGKMTPWRYFNKDPKFYDLVKNFIISIKAPLPDLGLEDAWGIKINKYDFTREHAHGGSLLSGVLYFSDCEESIEFPELRIKVLPKKGTFLLFSGWLKHRVDIQYSEVPKYAIAMNFKEQNQFS